MYYKLFFELIQVAICHRDSLSRVPSAAEWNALYSLSVKQAVVGVCFCGVQRLPKEQIVEMPVQLKMQWFALAESVKQRNDLMNRRCVEVQRILAKEGMESCIIKGQGVARLYDFNDNDNVNLNDKLGAYRQSGDIDIYVPCGMDKALRWCRKRYGDVEFDYINAHVPVFKDVEVELHWRLQSMTNLFKNRKLQRWLEREETKEMILGGEVYLKHSETKITVPTLEFNAFYQMLHCYHHMFESGLGLRQLMDYYFLLLHVNSQGNNIKKSLIKSWISEYGMKKFASAIMWILGEVFGLKREYMLFNPDEREGRFILNEIMQSGNFGHYDNRMHSIRNKWIGPFATRIQHNWHLATHYPSEFFWAPVWLIYHFFWKRTLSN